MDEAWGIARAIFFQGFVAIESGDFARARPRFEECLERFTELGAEHDVLLVLFNPSWACEELGDQQRARDLAEECLQRSSFGKQADMAFALDLVSSHVRATMVGSTMPLRRRSKVCESGWDEGDVQHQLDSLAASRHSRARVVWTRPRRCSSSVHLHEELGMLVPLYQREEERANTALIHAELDGDHEGGLGEQGKRLTLDEAVALAVGESATDA